MAFQDRFFEPQDMGYDEPENEFDEQDGENELGDEDGVDNKENDDEKDGKGKGLNNKASEIGGMIKDPQTAMYKPIADAADKAIELDAPDGPLSAKEEAEAYAMGAAVSALLKIPPDTYGKIVKGNGRLHRKVKKLILISVVISLVASILPLIMQLIVQAAPILIVIAIIAGAVAGQEATANNPPPLSVEEFYGVRIIYKNDELSSTKLLQDYNELAFEFLNSVSNIEVGGSKIIKEFKIELPESFEGTDFNNYSNELTNKMVYEIAETILNVQLLQNKEEGAADPEPVEVTEENLTDCLIQIDHFGLNINDFVEISKNLTSFFVGEVKADVSTPETSDDEILTFNDGYTFDETAFSESVLGTFKLLTDEASGEVDQFARFKVSSDKVYVKDVIAGSEDGIEVNGVITHYIYMTKTDTTLKNRHYGIQITDESKYSVSFVNAEDGAQTLSNTVVADKTWVKTGAEIKEGNIGDASMFFKDDACYFNEQIELLTELNSSKFTNIDENNIEFLAQDELSVIDAFNQNNESARLCFAVIGDELPMVANGFTVINSLPTCDYVGLVFEDVTENGTGTAFVFADLE